LIVAAIAAAVGLNATVAASCSADFDGDETVEIDDLLVLLADWGECDGCPTDLDGNGIVDVGDLLELLAQWDEDCASFVMTELAGNSLAQYPYFEYVTAFNQVVETHVALDPGRFPDVVGQTCDIYIVEAKTAAQWDVDPSLTDVTFDGPQTETFVAGSIQDNTFLVSNGSELDGDAGLGIGVPYDIVCDCNQNGELDGGDYIDGYNTGAINDRAHGMYIVHDLTQPGPLEVSSEIYSVQPGTVTPGFEQEEVFYPTNIDSMGLLPLIVVSHGNGHNYRWYDHIGEHMASYGYIVMSHANNTIPGVFTASTTTLEHTDAFLSQLPDIVEGALVGHVDTDRIVWLGHSRGGEGVTIAYDRIVDGSWTPEEYELDDIVLVSSIAPVDFLGPSSSNPHGAIFHLWTGGADDDVNGCAGCNLCQTFHLHDRALGYRQSISLHGVGHGDFHNGGGSSVADGPCLVGRSDTHKIMRGYLLPLVKHYVEGNVPAKDFLWRQYERFRPIGAPRFPCVVVDLMYREGPNPGYFAIDDYQSEPSSQVSSSGGEVTWTVSSLTESRLDDDNSSFTNSGTDPMNGMTVGGDGDDTRGVVFSWNDDSWYEFEIIPDERDLTRFTYLSFRAAQSARHPNTVAELGDLTFTVTLRDENGVTSSINIGAYGGGIEEPYQRTGCGSGVGWANEFETIRIRLTDFLNGGIGLDLTEVEAVRFEFGPSFGSSEGRIGLDDVALTDDSSAPIPGSLSMVIPDEVPTLIPPDVPTSFDVIIFAGTEELVEGSALLHYRYDAGVFQTVELTPLGGDLFEATLPPPACGETPEFYISAEGSITGEITLPEAAPDEIYQAGVGVRVFSFSDDFESDTGWVEENLGATTGDWERAVPIDDDSWDFDPPSDSDGSGKCYVTSNQMGNSDVDDGAVRVTSPTFDMSFPDSLISYDYFFLATEVEGGVDRILVEVSNDDGETWVTAAIHDTDGGLSWRNHIITSQELIDAGVAPTATMRARFTANDADPQSIVEAGLDAFAVYAVVCE
jgi:hypothetical protein